jgi:hypothetical protein
MRVILHAGFHKTGTSSLQACLAANRASLAPYARILLLDELAEPLRCATRYSTGQDPFDLASFAAAFAHSCERAAVTTPVLLISCEGLSGRTPGKKGIVDYTAAVPLAQAMASAVKAVFGGKTPLSLIYTTRAAVDWMSSAWRHNLFGYRVTEDFETFCARCPAAADFAAITAQIARKLPRAEVISVALEQVQQAALGPAEAVLAQLNLPEALRAALHNPGWRNLGRDGDTTQALLALNRSDLPDDEIKRRKAALLRPGTMPRLG